MGERIEDGGPAFPKPLDPYPNAQGMESGCHGMSLRDWFAGQFLAGAVASPDGSGALDVASGADQHDIDAALRGHWDTVARTAYIAADAMLLARAKASPHV